MSQITVLIADDHALFREGLVMLLAQQDDIEVVGEAADGLQALRMAEALQPDIVLLDILMPEVGGLEVLPKIRAKSPRTKVLVLSGFAEDEYISEALQYGAKGYLLKTTTHADLAKAIRAAHAGEIWAERRVLTQVMGILVQKVHNVPFAKSPRRGDLTTREQEIVKQVIQGMTNKEIATHLGISEKTVKTHLRSIFRKLKISRRLQLLLTQIADRPA